MRVKVTTLSFQCRDKLNFTTMPENVPIMLALCLMLARPYYAPNYAGIIRPSLLVVQRRKAITCTTVLRNGLT